jgi:hypothetical protein
MDYTKEQIEKMADEYSNQFIDGRDHFYGFIAGFEKALSLLSVGQSLPNGNHSDDDSENLLKSI